MSGLVWIASISTVKTRPEKHLFCSEVAELQEVVASDLPALEEYSWILWRAAYEPHLFDSGVSQLLWARSYSRPALEMALENGEEMFWVMMDGKRAGFLAYRLEAANRRMRLSKIYLHPDYWSWGLGGWLLGLVTKAALNAGVRVIDLYVFRRNQRAVRAYQRAGFRVAREELTDLGGG